ncbi:MAG: molybdate ABC transporter substrate-binding protein [Peptococcaceae bacterium]|nr:molybdate ABC transporter substrate-binding protein [Peptococcaceae bacterium]
MKRRGMLLVIVMVCLLLAGCSNSPSTTAATNANKAAEPAKKEILVSAAASLKNPMTEIEKVYEEKNTGINLTFNFNSSGSLQTQIEQGAPADIFLSAGKSQMDALEQKNLLASGTRSDFAANDLVLVVGEKNTSIKSFQDLTKADKISIGTPESVPAGKYAQEALTKMKLWDSLKPKMVLAKDVTQVLTYVESENVQAGIVYGSDAHESKKVRVVATAPADSHSPIVYPGSVIASSKNQTEAKAFLQFINSPEGQAILVKYGFKANK